MKLDDMAKQAKEELELRQAKQKLSEMDFIRLQKARGIKQVNQIGRRKDVGTVQVFKEVLDALRLVCDQLDLRMTRVAQSAICDKLSQLIEYQPDQALKEQARLAIKRAQIRANTDRRYHLSQEEREQRRRARERNARLKQEYIDRYNVALAIGDKEELDKLRQKII